MSNSPLEPSSVNPRGGKLLGRRAPVFYYTKKKRTSRTMSGDSATRIVIGTTKPKAARPTTTIRREPGRLRPAQPRWTGAKGEIDGRRARRAAADLARGAGAGAYRGFAGVGGGGVEVGGRRSGRGLAGWLASRWIGCGCEGMGWDSV
jgi:hypothetical protein